MKKLFMAFLALTITTAVMADVGPVGRSTSLNADGTSTDVLEKWFINVKNTSGGSISAGAPVILDETELDGFSVNTSSTAGKTVHCVVAVACADDALCKCQTYGVASVTYDATGDDAVAGAPAFIGETSGGTAYGVTTPDALDRPFGIFLEAKSTSGSVSTFLKMR
ncbi:MAG: hypothetical protein CL529_12095 [Aequorivita sp.]|nr:hypothetical protein [Aequorivita sp.]|tara:strand:+ start:9915 stop:10412 length:498 start_codon:yes stop_codon:yes gene_type:complete